MFKALGFVLLASLFVACGESAGPPTRAGASSYAVVSEQPDPASRALTLVIRVPGAISQSGLKALTESIISERRSGYRHLTITSYADDMAPGDKPLAISTLEGDTVSHTFNPDIETQKIHTH